MAVPWILDRSYLVSFVWFESGQGLVNEVHVNLRGLSRERSHPRV